MPPTSVARIKRESDEKKQDTEIYSVDSFRH